MFIMAMFTGILSIMMYYYSIPPAAAINLYDVPSPTQSPQASKAEVFGGNMVSYHKGAVRYMQANPTFQGTIPDQDVRNQLAGSYNKMGTWVSVAATDGGGKSVFTYAQSNPSGVTTGMMVGGMARANGFGWGTGVKRNGKMLDAMVQATVVNQSNTASEGGLKKATVWDRPDIDVPAAIPENTALQVTKLQ